MKYCANILCLIFFISSVHAENAKSDAEPIVTDTSTTVSRYLIETKDNSRLEVRDARQDGDHLHFTIGGQQFSLPKTSISRFVTISESNSAFRIYREADPADPIKSSNALMDRHDSAVVTIKSSIGAGSGFFIHEDGYLITNAHVIEGEHPEMLTVCQFVKTKDGSQEKAHTKIRIVAIAGRYDIALLKVEGEPEGSFPALPLADSTMLVQGDRCFTIGSPLGLSRSVSEGNIAQPKRLMEQEISIYGFYIQHTAPISPGNSGGPLLNFQGHVLGINTLGNFSGSNLGFAIPTDWLKTFLRNREAFLFEPSNPANGTRYLDPQQ
jgi:serine protease Do